MIRALPATVCALALLLSAPLLRAQAPDRERGADPPELPPVYRVEVIAFEHVGGESDRRPAAAPADFSDHADPLLIASAHRFADAAAAPLRTLLPMLPRPGAVAEATPLLESDGETLRPIPPVYADLDPLPEPMARAFDRLAASPAHAPVARRAWLQLAQRGGDAPALRLHDDVVVETRPAARPGAPPFLPDWLRVPVSADADGRLRERRLLRPDPPRLALYRLDGTLRLQRRQFLHVELDLVWQQRAERIDPDSAADADGRWLQHRMVQSRVVEPGRIEYFDASRFGVLVRVTRFDQVVPRPEPAPVAAPRPATADAG